MHSSKPIPVTAVFDIGKTNKKFLLFDENYSVVYKKQAALEQAEDEDGYPCEDLDTLRTWIHNNFNAALEDERFEVSSLNFSTYGASLVHLDESGEVVTPLYNYLKPIPEDLTERFYGLYGGREQFSLETSSPPMGMLNSGLQLYWLKHERPSLFSRIRHSLHFPQYLSYLFTGEYTTERTSLGCHTALWNYEEDTCHRWVEEEGLNRILPEMKDVTYTRNVRYNNRSLKVGVGIHDSSAALAPYLYFCEDPFILVSTGTWSIALNPFSTEPLTFEELKKDCLCYMNIFGEQVKASRLFLGNEYAHQKKKLEQYFGRKGEQAEIEPDESLLEKLISENDSAKKLQLETAHSSGPYPGKEPGEWNLEVFSSYEEAYHQLMLDLVSIQAHCIELAQGGEDIDELIVTGGFSQNNFFVRLLASRFPNKEIYTASLPHASALGAALAVNNDQDTNNVALKELPDLRRHLPFENLNIKKYFWNRSVAI